MVVHLAQTGIPLVLTHSQIARGFPLFSGLESAFRSAKGDELVEHQMWFSRGAGERELPLGSDLAVAQNLRARATQVLVHVSTYQGSILVPVF